MRKHTLVLTALSLMAGLAPIQAQTAPAPQPVATAPATDYHPYHSKDLYPAWSRLTPAQGLIDARAGLAEAYANIERICTVKPEEATYENVFAAYAHVMDNLDQTQGLMYHLSTVADSPEIRAAREELIPEAGKLNAHIIANEKLWQTIKSAAAQPWVKELSPAKQRHITQVLNSFRDNGADLSAEAKARLAEISTEHSSLTSAFAKNVLDSTNACLIIIRDKAQLAGMSEDWMTSALKEAEKRGEATAESPAWAITAARTSVNEVLRNCEVEATRKLCWEMRNSVGGPGKYDNAPIVAKVMELRKEMATLLGFGTYADQACCRRMVGSGEAALKFVDGMMERVKPAFDREIAQVMEFISSKKGEKITKINPWDTTYYNALMSEELYGFDPETLRPYLVCDNVIKGMFSIAETLFGISFSERETAFLQPGETCPEGKVEVWHPEVRVFEVKDQATGRHLGSFYMDLFPRKTKRAGAWVMPMFSGVPADPSQPRTPNLATLAGNMTPATEGKPALFSHYDAVVIFHEFGHMMHNMLSDTELRAHAGTSVAWDFVELPSQLMENWVWTEEGLATFARHHETGAPMPADMIKKLQASQFFLPAMDNMSQLCLAKLDLEMHTRYDELFKGKDLDQATAAVLGKWSVPYSIETPSFMRRLAHCINGGYKAGYYCYKWAEVLAADAWTRFEAEGCMNPETGRSFRECILSKGDSKPAAEIFRDFMGHEPNPDALLIKQGLLPAEK